MERKSIVVENRVLNDFCGHKDMDFSGIIVSIVTYNNQDVIKKAIMSIIENTSINDYRIVIFDNNSCDDTLNVIRSIDDSRIDIISSSINYGFGYGHNRIAEKYPRAEVYLIYNPDLFLTDDLIVDFRKIINSDDKIGMLVPKVCFPNGEIQHLCKRNPTVWDLFMRRFMKGCLSNCFIKRRYWYEMRNFDYDSSFEIEYASGCCMFIRGNIFRDINGFDEKIFMYLEDADITREIARYKRVLYMPTNIVHHLWGKGAHHSLKLMIINIKSAIYYFNKWGWDLY